MIKNITLIVALFFVTHLFADNRELQNQYVGYKVCTSCHEDEVKQWQTSHHYKAMQYANETNVSGDFNQSIFENYGLMTTFYEKRSDKGTQFWVKTDGPDGKLQDYPIKYTFGVYPLQQYLIEFPGGRLQALDIAWDARDKEQGGQRWFHLHPKEKIASDDILHWTGPNMNWNYMCAYCHSTNLNKNYQSETDSYETTYSEINVSCEACHGPASKHLDWADKQKEASQKDDGQKSDNKTVEESFKNKGLTHALNERSEVKWIIDPETHKPYRSKTKDSHQEIETCARCHSRRSQLANDAIHQPLMNSFRPARLSSSLYYADGQPKDEVYVYGSFIQSKMYHEGVTCSDCHNPHSNKLKLPGDQVCNQCHLTEAYRSESHHFHTEQSAVSCIDCHMSPTTYMGVDVRNDHSFRIPRPDISKGTDIPNACNKCHTVNTSQWAEKRLGDWYKKRPVGLQKFTSVLQDLNQQHPMVKGKLHLLIKNNEQPAIARATALEGLMNYPDQISLKLIATQLQDKDPMIRLAALEALVFFNKRSQISLAFPLIYDDMMTIRMEAGRLLAAIPQGQLSTKDKTQLKKVQQEYLKAQLFNAERPEFQVNLGLYYFQQGKVEASEQAYQKAIQLQDQFIPAYLGLAQLYVQADQGTHNPELRAQTILKEGIARLPENASLHHTLGLSLIRSNQPQKALAELEISANLDRVNRRYQFVYAIALNSLNQTDKSLIVLERTLKKNPYDSEILVTLITINREAENYQAALKYAVQLNEITPDNPDLKRLIFQLKKQIK